MCSKPSKPSSSPMKTPKVGNLGDVALDQLSGLILVRNVAVPGIIIELLESKCDSATLLVDTQHAAIQLLTFFEQFARVTDLSGPRHVADV